METIQGKKPCTLDLNKLHARLTNHQRVILDLGTGDGKFAFHHARTFPCHFVIGVDSCRENLHEYSRAKISNLLFVIANAQNLPHELNGLISHITINFPWGSLLESLLNGDSGLTCGLKSIACPNTAITIRLNGGALSEAGTALEAGADRIQEVMRESGWQMKNPSRMGKSDLQTFPSTWAKRLAFGRDPRAIELTGTL
ncbi:MAG: class I SAM-dependent methyltransferase [Anaerolineales bacterium]|nr:class I SAM-dependent methyltransferase [Anaerolineales bacterium]